MIKQITYDPNEFINIKLDHYIELVKKAKAYDNLMNVEKETKEKCSTKK